MTTLFEYISSAVVDGELPGDFSLPDLADDENELKWADGALDGVTMYHMTIPEIGKGDRTLISDAVRAASKGDYDLADSLFKMLGKHLQAIIVIDDLQAYIVDNQRQLNAKNLFEYAIHLLFESDNRECLKFGLSLLELFKTNDKSGSYRHRQYAPQLYGICERRHERGLFLLRIKTVYRRHVPRL